ncbi:MAG TPA: reverse transcriptase domain-containing protein [Candidatus Paceibacterota bacterium]|nr:reverse transcriptase domain-containing protein [Candidatus Paceibacterota bacterium]
MKIQFIHSFEKIAGMENLLEAWEEFARGKRDRRDVREFSLHLMDNLFSLHNNLINHTYLHGEYQAFNICDPKPRNIHKATVRDRILHRAIHRVLYPFFDKTFIADSFSCRVGKGTHAALNRFRLFAYTASKNHTKTCWILKCDIRKFFSNIDHEIIVRILANYISDKNLFNLLREIIGSFSSSRPGVGLPLGNLTSQLLVNIYMNEFDQFVKHRLKAKHYIRYADDFVIFSDDRLWLEIALSSIDRFLEDELHLTLHPRKVSIKTLASGVDFLGWVHFPDHRVLRTSTRKRMMRRINEHPQSETTASYKGLLGHGNAYKLKEKILDTCP